MNQVRALAGIPEEWCDESELKIPPVGRPFNAAEYATYMHQQYDGQEGEEHDGWQGGASHGGEDNCTRGGDDLNGYDGWQDFGGD